MLICAIFLRKYHLGGAGNFFESVAFRRIFI